MDLGKNQQIRLEAQDEFTHPIEAEKNFNESMYINLFDHEQQIGGWFRVGNRPNEGYAEVSCCLYLPDGQVAFMYQRPAIENNDTIAAGGMNFEVLEPFKLLKVTHKGDVCVLSDPSQMENPKAAFKSNPHLNCEIELTFTNIAPVYGGEAVDENGNPIQENPEESFARAHYEQHMAGAGTIKVGDTQYEIKGYGLRDHSWGPRYWQNLYWYRWLPMVFTRDFAMNISIVTMANGRQHIWGMVLEGNEYHLIEESTLSTQYDDRNYPTSYSATVKTANQSYVIEADVISQIPLRNRRQKDNGDWMHTRIIEGFTRFQCNGIVGYGMTEYLDQMIDGVPVGIAV
ncbi:MAG: hypothetical protein MI867_05445 [Pseudomonadales bacterium]|nr:hypothetical protein [Pseudomonadales bacterium]